MKGITVILHDLMEYLNECGHDYKYGTLKVEHNIEHWRKEEYPQGVIELIYYDKNGEQYGVGSVYREEDEHAFE